MYHLDPNINTAVERQAEHVRAVQACGSRQSPEPGGPPWTAGDKSRSSRVISKVSLALAAAPFVLLVAWGLLTR